MSDQSPDHQAPANSNEDSPHKTFEQLFPHTAARLASQSRDEGAAPPPLNLSDAEGDDEEGGADAASKRLEERLRRAARRREAMLEERRVILAAQEEQRRGKLRQVAKLRKEALQVFIRKAPAVLAAFKQVGLTARNGEVPSVEDVERILMSDPRSCDKCVGTANEQKPTCPVTKKPHRRSLVVFGEQLLRLIGNARVNLAPSKLPADQQVVESMPIGPTEVTRRGISIHPHLFVLIFYNAALKQLEDEVELILHMCAAQLVDLVEELRQSLKDPSTVDSRYVQELLASFARAWRPYAKYADGVTAENRTPVRRRFALEELKQSVLETYVSSHVAIHRQQLRGLDTTRIRQWADRLEERLQAMDREAVAHAEDMITHRVDTEMPAESPLTRRGTDTFTPPAGFEPPQSAAVPPPPPAPLEVADVTKPATPRQQANPTDSSDIATPPVTPESRPKPTQAVAPAAPSMYYGTSGSDTDSAGAGLSLRYFGPELPPMWFVDADGISRPPPPAALQQALLEQRKKLEYRARTAFQMKLKLVDDKTEAENAVAEANQQVLEATYTQFEAELNQSPRPNLQRVPMALNAVVEALVEALPKRLRGRVGKELHDVLDWSSLRKAVSMDTMQIAHVMQYVIEKVSELGAPARAEQLQVRSQELTDLLSAASKPLGEVVVQMFRFMLESIRQLRLDIAQFTLQMVSGEMIRHTEEYHQEYLAALGPTPSWSRSVPFVQTHWRSAEANRLEAEPGFEVNATATTETESRLRAAVFSGALDLLKSANRCSETRWASFPTESMSVEQGQIFKMANAVQRDTIRLMMTGTISMLISRKPGVTPPMLTTFLQELDKTIVDDWLPRAANVQELKDSVVDTVNMFLAGTSDAPTLLAVAEENVLRGLVDKMIDTCSSTYNTFEGRVLATIRTAFVTDPVEWDRIPPSARPPTAGLATASAWEVGGCLRRIMDYHWSVLRPSYVAIANNLSLE